MSIEKMNLSSDIEELGKRLRRENYHQFQTLVRMHLSFVLHLTTDENESLVDKGKLKKWSLVPFRKQKPRGIMEGAPLTQEGICQVYQLIEFLKKEQNICKEGVFRRTGSLNRQHDLKNLLNQGTILSLDEGPFSVHDVASVLKGFLAELSEPLLTEAHYPAYCQISELCGVEKTGQEDRLLEALQLLLLLLPTENCSLLKDVLELLNLTASYEGHNKMSAENLATLFTPHLLCPRKLSPENLHHNSQMLSGIVSFMIKRSADLFQIPHNLGTDIRAFLQEKDRKRELSPSKRFNESLGDNLTANTVFSFVDHERTAKENQSNPTETALAQLYAHIQGMPESSKKRKLVKQFNKENGQGTPLQVLRTNVQNKNKTIGNSIKKHIFQKGLIRNVKKTALSQLRSNSDEVLSSPSSLRGRLFCTNCDSSPDATNDEGLAKKLKREDGASASGTSSAGKDSCNVEIKRSISEPDLSSDSIHLCNGYITSTPACGPLREISDNVFTPEDQDRRSMSPITRSAQRMCRAMQETMMTPRSRKPVLLVSGTNLKNLATIEKPPVMLMDKVMEEEDSAASKNSHTSYTNENNSLTQEFRSYLHTRSILTASPTDLSFSSRTDDYSSTNVEDLNGSKMSASLMHCMDGNVPDDYCDNLDKEPVLKPKQFDENGLPTVYETSF